MNPMLPRRWRCLRGLRPLTLIDANLPCGHRLRAVPRTRLCESAALTSFALLRPEQLPHPRHVEALLPR